MPFLATVLTALIFLWELIKTWLYTFAVSFIHVDTLWIIIPIWLSWFFAEFFQERQGTDFGNAISNGVIPLWVGIDWIRQLTLQLTTKAVPFAWSVLSKYLIAAILISYGLLIIVFGIKGKAWVKYVGRIREVTYILVIFTPFIYGYITPDFKYWISSLVFFPLFYFLIEMIDKDAPPIKTLSTEGSGMPSANPANSWQQPPKI